MKRYYQSLRPISCIAVATVLINTGNLQVASAENSASDNGGANRTPREIMIEMSADQKIVNDLLGKGNTALKTAADREAVAPKLSPSIHRMQNDLNELSTAVPQLKEQVGGSQMQLLALISVLGEKPAIDQIEAMTSDKDPSVALNGQAHQIMSRFYVAENSVPVQTALVDDLQKLDRANPNSLLLTQLTIEMGHEEILPDISQRLLDIAVNEMTSPLAASLKAQLKAKKEAAAQDALVANKPLVLAGILPDGSSFSTDSFKGKVILIDFWATWCGPCKEELPRVKKIYAEYHQQGLEVVGVSNDYNIEALKDFVANQNMPWPELFDPNAAANREWNAITTAQKIDGIPVMYLIDKKGVLRTVNARLNMEEVIPKLLAE